MRPVQHSGIKNGYRPSGGIRFFSLLASPLLLLVLAATPQAETLPADATPPVATATPVVSPPVEVVVPDGAKLVRRLVRAQTPHLALAMLDQKQPKPGGDLTDWLYWERLRITILTENGLWERFDARLASLPKGVDEGFRRWAVSMRARALIDQGEPLRGRELLLGLMWEHPQGSDDTQLAEWRQLVIQAYLSEGREADAYAAMLRYRQDYGRGDADAVTLFAQVLLNNDRASEAEVELKGLDNPQTMPLYWLARLRNGSDAKGVVKQLLRLRGKAEDDPGALYYAVLAEAAGSAGDLQARTEALEGLFARKRVDARVSRLVPLDSEQLWQAYLDLARDLGNRKRLLVGRDADWVKLAERHEKGEPTAARAIYAFLSLYSYDDSARADYHRSLARLLLNDNEQGRWLVERLYLTSPRFIEVVAIPEVVRRVLVDFALATADLDLAARLLKGFDAPPAGADAISWELRRAKVFLLTGEHEQGEKILRGMLDKLGGMDTQQFDRYVQGLFDLQTVEHYDAAYELFLVLYERVQDLQIKRELLFWMADSRFAQARWLEAGYLYLQSAIILDKASMDPWAQTARYQAAKALVKAEMFQDAENLYRQLLKVADQAERKAQLLRDLEQLKLLRSAAANRPAKG